MNAQADIDDTVGIRLARQVLTGDDEAMIDLRAQRGVSIDAFDELRPFYALKVCSGTEPDEIRLTTSEARRALDNESFFLVIVSMADNGSVERTVRIITAPLERLRKFDDHGMHLGGVKSANSFPYRIATGDET